MFMIGRQHYGKTDHLKGLFFVTTEFFTVNMFPIIPVSSYCLLDQGRAMKGVKIPHSVKSILLGYFRGIVCVLSVVFLILGLSFIILDFKKIKWGEFSEPVIMVAGGLLGGIFLGLSYLWQKPKPLRALELAKQLDIPLSTLAEHFVNDHHLELLMLRTQDEATAAPPPEIHH
ncbi:MAG TPA: hypothetical protein PLN21_11460 [Gemmatales bacterium]|nr:hypothetical protein [Gemmatales bacterium]